MPLFQKDGIWYWSDGNPLDVTSPAALYADINNIQTYLPTLNHSPPAADVVCPREITFTLAGKPGVTINVVEDGGNLDFTLTANTTDKKSADLSGLFFDLTNSKLSTLSVSGDPQITQFVTQAGGVINLTNGVNLNGLKVPAFDVGMEFGLAGIGSDHQNIQTTSFVLSDSAHDLSINDLHPTGETGTVGVRTLSDGQKLAAVAPYAPTATPDTVTTLEDVPTISIPVGNLATDMNSGTILSIDEIGSGAEGPQYGTVTVAPDGKSLIYTPTTLDYEVDGILTGNQDAFQVCVTDNFGGEVTSFVTVNATPVADVPTVVDAIAAPSAGDAATLVRLDVSITSDDFATIDQGSDYIKSLALSLTGNNTNGISVTDSAGLLSNNLITPPANQGRFTDEILVSLPVASTFMDQLSMTGTNAETENTGSPATAAATVSQTITADTETTLEDIPITIPIGNLVSGANMTITEVAPGPLGPKYGTVAIAPDGKNLIYTPTTLDYEVGGVLTGDRDVFQVHSSDGAGNNAVTLLTVNATPVADTPTVSLSVGAGTSATDTLITVTVDSGDFGTPQQGSDYIQSLLLNLTGNETAGVTLSDSLGLLNPVTDIITTTGDPSTFTDVIDVSAPTSLIGQNFDVSDVLGVTAVNAETEGTGSPATASSSVSQPIQIDFGHNSQTQDFQAMNQSIWGTGNAFTTDLHKFLGLGTTGGAPISFGKKVGGTVIGFGLSASATLSLKAGFQVDLHVDSGDLNADLPFNITFDSIDNKTTNTLVIDPTETPLSGGQISSTGPNGMLEIDFILDAMAKYFAKATAFGTTVADPHGTFPFDFKTTLVKLDTGHLSTSVPIPPGDPIATLDFNWPQLNTTPTGNGPGTASSSGTSNPIASFNIDLVALALAALGINPDPLNFSVSGLDVDLLSLSAGFNVNTQQQLNLSALGLTPALTLEDGTVEPLTFGTPLTIPNASSHDTNHDGMIGLSLTLTPDASLKNVTSIGGALDFGLTIGKFGFEGIDGAVFDQTVNIPIGSVPVYQNTFAVNFQPQTEHVNVA
jgi:hypothetical protein